MPVRTSVNVNIMVSVVQGQLSIIDGLVGKFCIIFSSQHNLDRDNFRPVESPRQVVPA